MDAEFQGLIESERRLRHAADAGLVGRSSEWEDARRSHRGAIGAVQTRARMVLGVPRPHRR
jgi:hypothetical protein